MKHWWLLVLLGLLIFLFLVFDLGRFLSLETLKSGRDELQQAYQARPLQMMGLYAGIYIVIAALSLPGAGVMTLAGGAIFGFWVGIPLAVVSASIGATVALWMARYVFREFVQQRFSDRMTAIDAGIKRDGAFYLFTLRLVPIFPFFIINLLMGLTAIPSRTFFWASLLGMLPGTAIYVNAGTQLASITQLSDIFSPALIGSFALLAVFPWLARWGVERVRMRGAGNIHAQWTKPIRFDRNLVVIGAGSGGLVTSYLAAATRARVTLIEANRMGGDCLNFGCVPSKTLIRSATFLREARHAKDLGFGGATVDYSFGEVMARVQRIIKTIEPHDSVERYTKLGVEVIHGKARITSPWTVEVNGQTISTRAIVIATGARPAIPPIPGLEQVRYYTSDTIWSLTERPGRLVVLGGGPIGCELAQAFALLDCQVTQVARSALLEREDTDVVALIESALRADGVRLLTQTDAIRCESEAGEQRLVVRRNGKEEVIPFDAMLCAVGRTANIEGFGLEELGIPNSPKGTIETDAWLQTLYPNIYACGDVVGPYQFTHVAAHQAWYA
ncbi:MAG: FAD-dependent oxidoreductase, partial [Nitrosospira sp.]